MNYPHNASRRECVYITANSALYCMVGLNVGIYPSAGAHRAARPGGRYSCDVSQEPSRCCIVHPHFRRRQRVRPKRSRKARDSGQRNTWRTVRVSLS